MTRRLSLFVALLVCAAQAACVHQPSISVASPAEVGLSTGQLDEIRVVSEAQVEEGSAAGVVALIARDGHVVYHEAFGWRDREAETSMEVDSIFRIYSMTKPITSVAVMILVEQGRVGLDDPVSRWLPELARLQVLVERDGSFETVAAEREMTVRDLLRHTSGLIYGVFSSGTVDRELARRYTEAGVLLKDRTLAETVSKLSDLPLAAQPGDAWMYGVNTDVLAHVVEVASGQSFDAFLQKKIFGRLGMVDTSFVVPETKLDRLAQLYAPAEDGGLRPDPGATRSYMGVEGYLSGGAGLYSTAEDYYRFCQMLLNGGKLDAVRILGSATVRIVNNHINAIFQGLTLGHSGALQPRVRAVLSYINDST